MRALILAAVLLLLALVACGSPTAPDRELDDSPCVRIDTVYVDGTAWGIAVDCKTGKPV